jgi:hypothetical protein
MQIWIGSSTVGVGLPVTFKGTLKWYNPLSKQWVGIQNKVIKIWHYTSGVRYIDPSVNTSSNGTFQWTQTFTYLGTRTYYASFAGDSSYGPSQTGPLTVPVKYATKFTSFRVLTAQAAVGQRVKFIGTLKSYNPATKTWEGEAFTDVNMYHYTFGVRYNDTDAALTNASGTFQWTQTFTYPAVRTYYASYVGWTDGLDGPSQTGPLTVPVKFATKFTSFTASNTSPHVNQPVTFSGLLQLKSASGSWTGLGNKSVNIWHSTFGYRYDGPVVHTSLIDRGYFGFIQKFGYAGARYYHATFAGDSNYWPAGSSTVVVNVVA